MDTNSSAVELLSGSAFVAAIAGATRPGAAVPVLIMRMPAFAERAWRSGKHAARRLERRTARAFCAASRAILRERDALGHDAGSDWFAVAMLEPARTGSARAAIDARAALERIAVSLASASGLEVQTGWCDVDPHTPSVASMDGMIALALERGARERERFEFFASVGHELRTPLTSIRGYLETLLEQHVEPPTARRFLEVARGEAMRMARLVDGMLEFSLLDLSADASLNASTDVYEQINAACAVLAPIAAQRGIRLHPRDCGTMRARLREDVLMHVLVNLIENAIKYGKRGGVVEVRASLRDGYAIVAVDDDGPGIAALDHARIFGLRERGPHARIRGNGIGLSIVKTIAERAGGDVRVAASTLGGSQFLFRVPQSPILGAESSALPS